jgi:hypothetical protein
MSFLASEQTKKRNESSGIGIAEGGARTLDLEVGISVKIRATRSTD